MADLRPTLLARAAEQHAVLTWPTARGVGMARSSFDHLLQTNECEQLLPGAHLVAGAVSTPHAVIMAAVLVTGPDAVASHATALRLWKLFDLNSSSTVDVTIAHRRRRRTITGVRVHRTRHFHNVG